MVLDDPRFIRRYDRSQLLQSIEQLHLQCRQALQETALLRFSRSYRSIRNVVIAGMGGSAIGGHIIQSLLADRLPWPVSIVNDEKLPSFVGPETLLLLSSYSGDTQETVSAAYEGLRRRAKITGITTGGALGRFFKKHRIPAYCFSPRHNPCGQPRMGLGYSIVGQIGLLSHVAPALVHGLLAGVGAIQQSHQRFGPSLPFERNPAKQLAVALQKTIPVFIAPQFLAGNLHTFANQVNENAKRFASWFTLPELAHHLLEGLQYPSLNRQALTFVFFDSSLVDRLMRNRLRITKTIVRKQHINVTSVSLTAPTSFAQSFELLTFGSYVSFYCALLKHLDPSRIPFVQYFKKALASGR